MSATSRTTGNRVRSIFYLPGLDPAGSTRYHRMLRREAESHNTTASDGVIVGEIEKVTANITEWKITRITNDRKENIQYYFLDWSDIIRDSFSSRILPILTELIFSIHIISRLFTSFNMKNGKPFSLVFIYSVLVVMLYFGISVAASVLLYYGLLPLAGNILSLILSAISLGLVMKASLWLEPKVFAYFLLRTLNFSNRFSAKLPDPLSDRLARGADQIHRCLKHGDDVVIVGHSYGALLTAPLVERLLSSDGDFPPEYFDRLSILHLGALHPLVTLDRADNWYKHSIDRLAASGFRWIEVFSGYDALNFPGYDPRTQRSALSAGPVFRDVNFFEYCNLSLLSPRRFRIFRNHFRYLMARDRCCPFDYFDYIFAANIADYWNPPPEPSARVEPEPDHRADCR